ncbi:MAG: ABC transporter ATP-binding protein [bacterium]|nr:ABC transporter ATP-binding protein [bacterium]
MNHSNFIYENKTKNYDQKTIRRLVKYLFPQKYYIFLALLILTANSLLLLVNPYLFKIAIDSYIIPGKLTGLNKIALVYLLVLLLSFIIRYFQVYLNEFIGQRTIHQLRMEIFRHLLKLPLSFYEQKPVGRLMTSLTTDMEVLNELFTSGLLMTINDILMLLGIIIAMLFLSPKLALVTFSVLPFLIIATYFFRKKSTISFRKIRSKISAINAYLQENISGIKIIKLFNREEHNFRKFSKLNTEHRDAYLDTIFYYSVFYPIVEFISALGVALIILYGGTQTLKNAIPLGILIAFLQYLDRFFRPIEDLSEKYNIFLSAVVSGERIFSLLDTPDTLPDPKDPVELKNFNTAITFKNVYFSYKDNPEEQDYILKNINLTIKKGEKLAIVGATGAGKTSLINIITRSYEIQKGEILIDGVPVNLVNKKDLQSLFALIQQDFFLFTGSFKDNISLNDKAINIDKIKESARLSKADTFIEKYEKQYDQNVFERGAILSTGQKQLLSFARAIAFGRPILLMDEATSNVDLGTEKLIQEGLKNLFKNKTAIIIAHRLSTIRDADRIIVLHKGEIREEGTHDELLKKQGIYHKLYQMQFR